MRGHLARGLAGCVALAVAGATVAAAAPASAGKPGKWTKISSQSVSLINEAGLLRLDNGNLLVTYSREASNGDEGIGWTTIRPNGATAATGSIISGWEAVIDDPQPIRISNSRIITVFSGLRTLNPADTYTKGSLYSSSGTGAGAGWALDSTGLGASTSAYASYGTAALTTPGGPVAASTLNTVIAWRQGFNPSIPASTPDNQLTNGTCCLYDTELARDASTGEVYAGWYSNGSQPGQWVKRILPSSGVARQAPGSAPGGSSLSTDQAVALTGRAGAAGVFLAYCKGYPSCNRVALWRIGTPGPSNVPGSSGADAVAIAEAPNGRLWIVWDKLSTGRIYAVHTNPAAGRFGQVQSARPPAGTPSIYNFAAEGSGSRTLDVVINTSKGLFHTQFRPGLSLTASPRSFDGDRRTTVTFTVKDAGSPVSGALVAVGGMRDRTNASGVAHLTFAAGTNPGRYTASAKKPGFARGSMVLAVRN